MGTERVVDLVGVEVEHLLGVKHGPLVKMRVLTNKPVIVLGEMSPAQARQIAGHLVESAARAEYEADLHGELERAELPEQVIGLIFHAVRSGEILRHTAADGGS